MSEQDLVEKELSRAYASAIREAGTFQTQGVSKQQARDYLETPEGRLFFQRVIEAEPGAPNERLRRRAIEQLASGRELPRMEFIDDALVKIVASGSHDRSLAHSPYFAKRSDLENDLAHGHRLHDRYGLPIKSESQVYDLYEIRPKAPTEVFVSEIAPTSELGGEVRHAGGGTQYLVPNRGLFTEATRVGSIGNDLALHQELVANRGLGAPIAAAATEASYVRGAQIPHLARALGTAGLAATAYDALTTRARASDLSEHGSVLAAESEWNHFAGRNIGGWAGAVMGARTGVAAFGRTPHTAIGGGMGGALVGAVAGDRIADLQDSKKVLNQTDNEGVAWTFNGRQWLRQQQGDLTSDSVDNPRTQVFAALPGKADELNHLANNAAFDLAMRELPPSSSPFRLPAAADDQPSLQRADWQHDPQTRQWRRDIVVRFDHNDLAVEQRIIADPQRAEDLARQSADVVASNIANGPVALAARFEPLYRSRGWEMPEQMRSLLSNAETVVASDGRRYALDPDGHWRRDGVAATGILELELDATRSVLRPAMAQHSAAMSAIQPGAALSPQERDHVNLVTAYAAVGVAPNPETIDAVVLAIQRTREAHGIDAASTSLAPRLNAQGTYDIHSPLAHLRVDSDGVVRIAAITTVDDIDRARGELSGREDVSSAAPSERDRTAAPAAGASPAPVIDTPAPMGDVDSRQGRLQPFSDPGHPQHGLYSVLKSHLPEYTSEARLSQFTAACHRAGIKPHTLESVEVHGQQASFSSRSGWPRVDVDMREPSPPVHQSVEAADEVGRQGRSQRQEEQAQIMAQSEQQQAAAVMQR